MKLFLILFSLVVLLRPGGQPIVIPIQNPSFEQLTEPLTYSDYCGLEERVTAKIPAWKFAVAPGSGGAGGLLQPNGEKPAIQSNGCNVPLPPDGQTVAFAQDTTISQIVRVPDLLAGSGIYTLKFYAASYFYWYSGEYTVSLSLSSIDYGHPLCSVSGHPTGDFTQITLVCPINHHYAGDLTIVLYGKGWPVLFDDVSLTFTQQP